MNKEEAKERRKQAYREAKKKRDEDPAYQAMKEKAQAERKAHYRAIKDQMREEKLLERKKRQAEKDAALMAFVKLGSQIEN